MTFLLSRQNVFKYLADRGLCDSEDEAKSKVELKYAKNFNLLLSLSESRKILVKQERRDRKGKTAGEFLREWRIHSFLQEFPELSQISGWVSEVLHYDARESIIVFNYLVDYRDLMEFYTKENIFSTVIAEEIGKILGKIHCRTFNRQEYRDFLATYEDLKNDSIPNVVSHLERITPEIFGLVPADGLKFFTLYQRYDSLGTAIAELTAASCVSCLTHNDLKLNNILLSSSWEQALLKADSPNTSILRLIDWERSCWGDPAFDVGTLIASYLQLWLNSLITRKEMSIDESLKMATTPLEQLQPSLVALVSAYFTEFPEILQHRPDFLNRIIQFSGLVLIQQILATIQYQKSFGNTGICMLQVAKSLLCRPQASIPTIFGIDASQLVAKTLVPI
ncbi:aminoglycoside phosphotransferase [Scytonema hofmannii PCC 7110]|uniref:Aminoglycoside phosphotransferase n=1 Tax=Scytonema hofmannii PCC 7110 TaxID=128403 RepID=A0A139WYY6_9CYAN|nr:aminoglycoside phosphotransferase family protein [Scytonema hofmannii]KYC37648.1 aminoglycoside phosphotransferase [Scytonema hofmannii PCC 7110]